MTRRCRCGEPVESGARDAEQHGGGAEGGCGFENLVAAADGRTWLGGSGAFGLDGGLVCGDGGTGAAAEPAGLGDGFIGVTDELSRSR